VVQGVVTGQRSLRVREIGQLMFLLMEVGGIERLLS